MFMRQRCDRHRASTVQSHSEGHETAFPQCSSEGVRRRHIGRERQRASQSTHAEVRAMIRAIRDLTLLRETLDGRVEIGDIHDRALITNSTRANVLRDDSE